MIINLFFHQMSKSHRSSINGVEFGMELLHGAKLTHTQYKLVRQLYSFEYDEGERPVPKSVVVGGVKFESASAPGIARVTTATTRGDGSKGCGN